MDAPGGSVEIRNVHRPPGSTVKVLKVDFWVAVLDRVDAHADAARIPCGDFNSPWSEDEDGFVVGGGRANADEEARWQAAELGFLSQPKLKEPLPPSTRGG